MLDPLPHFVKAAGTVLLAECLPSEAHRKARIAYEEPYTGNLVSVACVQFEQEGLARLKDPKTVRTRLPEVHFVKLLHCAQVPKPIAIGDPDIRDRWSRLDHQLARRKCW